MTYDASRFTDTLVDEAIRKVVSGRVSQGLPALHLKTYDNVQAALRVLLEVDRRTLRLIKISDVHNAFAIERVDIARQQIHREQFERAAAAAAAALVAAPPQPSAPSATLNLDVAIEGLHPEGRRGGRLARRAADNSIVEIARRDAIERGWAVDTMFDPRLPRGVGAEPFDAAALHVEDDRSSSCGCELGWNASLIPKLVARLSADVAALPRADRELREHVVLQGPTFYSRGVQTLVLPGSVCESLTDQGAHSRHGSSASLDYIGIQSRFNCSLRRYNLPCLCLPGGGVCVSARSATPKLYFQPPHSVHPPSHPRDSSTRLPTAALAPSDGHVNDAGMTHDDAVAALYAPGPLYPALCVGVTNGRLTWIFRRRGSTTVGPLSSALSALPSALPPGGADPSSASASASAPSSSALAPVGGAAPSALALSSSELPPGDGDAPPPAPSASALPPGRGASASAPSSSALAPVGGAAASALALSSSELPPGDGDAPPPAPSASALPPGRGASASAPSSSALAPVGGAAASALAQSSSALPPGDGDAPPPATRDGDGRVQSGSLFVQRMSVCDSSGSLEVDDRTRIPARRHSRRSATKSDSFASPTGLCGHQCRFWSTRARPISATRSSHASCGRCSSSRDKSSSR